jgi:hypothetical protein
MVAWIGYFVGAIDKSILFLLNGVFIALMLLSAVLKRRAYTRMLRNGQGGSFAVYNRRRDDGDPSDSLLDAVFLQNTYATYFTGSFTGEKACVICLVDFNPTEPITAVKHCSHEFHTPCLREWWRAQLSTERVQPSCPTCRQSLVREM